MTALTAALCALLGLAVGSFLTVVAARVPVGQSVVRPRSRCPACAAQVRPRDNIPVLSWLLLRGRCRSCGTAIPLRYPLIEMVTAALFAILAVRLGPSAALPAFLYLAAAGIALSVIDLEHRRLPDVITLPSYAVAVVLLGIAALLTDSGGDFLRALAGGAALLGVYFALWFAQPGGMGYGDVKLAGVLGLYTGWLGWGTWVVGLFAAFFLGGAVSIGLLLLRRAGRKSKVPFGPFMVAGAVVAVLVGKPLFDAWLSLAL